MNNDKSPVFPRVLSTIIVLVQGFDIAIHAASDQLEPMRVVSNLIILAWVMATMFGTARGKTRSVALGAIGAYLGLNLLFLVLEGVTNSNTGEMRTMLFGLVIVTGALSYWLTVLRD